MFIGVDYNFVRILMSVSKRYIFIKGLHLYEIKEANLVKTFFTSNIFYKSYQFELKCV